MSHRISRCHWRRSAVSDRPFLHYNDLVLVSDVYDRSRTRRADKYHPADELAYKLLHNSRILLKITYLLSIKAISAATSKRIMQSMYLFEWLEKTEPKFAAILFITFFFYPFRGLISEAKICGLQIRWFGSIPVFFKNADLFDQCQKMNRQNSPILPEVQATYYQCVGYDCYLGSIVSCLLYTVLNEIIIFDRINPRGFICV